MLGELQQWETRGEIELYYFDEAGFSQRSALPYAWSPVGQPLRLPAFSHSKRLNVLGFLSRQGKLVYHETTGKVTTEEVIAAFDRLIAAKSPDAFSVVVMDNARIHRSAKFEHQRRRWIEHGIYVIFLPPYSPELNLIELLWRKVKYEWLPLHAYLSFEGLCDNVRKVLSGYGSEYQNIFV